MEICRVGIVFRSRGDKNCNILFISKYNKEMQLALGTSLFFVNVSSKEIKTVIT